MFGVSSDLFSLLLTAAVGLTIFILFSDFQDLYRVMEVSVVHYTSAMTNMCQSCTCLAVSKSIIILSDSLNNMNFCFLEEKIFLYFTYILILIVSSF